VLDDPKLGKLLFFDPTDPFTPIGEIPVHEQASLALIVAGDNGSLKRMPAAAADANLTTRHIEATLGPDGAIAGEMHEELHGWTAVVQRAQLRERGDDEYRKRVESRITARLRSAAVTDLRTSDRLQESQFALDLKFASGTFAQLMQGHLMIFQPSVIEAVDPLPFSNPKRVHPAVINARGWRDSVNVKLPAGFEVDEIPSDLRTDSPFGTYEATVKVKDGTLTFTRTLSLKSTVVAPEDYKKLKDFSDRVSAGDQAPVVLVRK
jgi:hypothetical protein